MLWNLVVLALLEQYLQWRYGPTIGVGMFLAGTGIRARSANLLCVGGILVLLVLLSR
jgi:hypothetical protein